jgi:hypothetical protein
MRGIGSYSEIKRKLALQRKKARESRQESAKARGDGEKKQATTNKQKHAVKNSNEAKQKTRKKNTRD